MNLKKIIVLLIFPLMSACSFVAPHSTDVSKEGLKGRVMYLKESSFEAVDKFGEIAEGERGRKSKLGFDYAKRFNRKGAMEEYSEFESNIGSLVYKNTISYDEYYQPTMQRSYSAHGQMDLKSNYTYDAHGLVVEIASCKMDGTLSARYTYKYDNDGRVLIETCYRGDGSFDWKKKYEYNRRGQVIEKLRDEADNRFDCTYIYVYNKKHQLAEEIVKDADRIFDKRYVFTYNRKGQRVLEESYNSSAKLYSRLQFEYNKRGHKIVMNELYAGDKHLRSYSYTYDYDHKGNWIRRIEYYNDKPRYIINREIEYYHALSRLLPKIMLGEDSPKSGDEGIDQH